MRSLFAFVAIVACVIGLNANANLAFDGSGNLFVSAANSNMILKLAPGGTKTTFAAGVEGALALDPAGNLFVGVSDATGTIFKFAPDGTKSTFATSVGNPSSLAFDSAGNLFVFDLESGSILKFAPNGNKTTLSAAKKPAGQMFADSMALACDWAGNLFAADSGSKTIFKFTPDGTKTTFATKVNAADLAFNAAGNLFVADFWNKSIFKFAPDGTRSKVKTALNAPEGIAVDSAGNLFVYDGPDTIFKVTPEGRKITFAQNRPEPVPAESEHAAGEEPGGDSSVGLPENYAKSYLIASATLSPDKKFAVIYPNEELEDASKEKNYLVALQPFSILRALETKSPYFQHESHGGLSAEWSDDSSVALITLDGKWGPRDVFLVEIRNGKLSRMTNILKKSHDLLLPNYRKAKAERYNEYFDFIFESEDEPICKLDGTNRVVIDAEADTSPNDLGLSPRAWHGHVEAVWDIAQAKFTSEKVSGQRRGAEAYRNRAESDAEDKQFAAAVQDIQKAIELDPKNGEYYSDLGWYQLFNRKPRESIAASLKALQLSPDEAVLIKGNLAHGYLFDNQFNKAKAIYLENKDAKLDDQRSFSQAVLDDFKEFQDAGITHPDMEKIKALLNTKTEAR